MDAQIEVTTTVTVPHKRIAGLLCCGFEGGSNYWCQIVDYIEPPTEPEETWNEDEIFPHIDYPLNGGAVICAADDDEELTDLRLDAEAIKRGLQLMALNAPRHWADFMAENEDATTGDVFLQMCLLGEIVYG
jgi:hypothetical protein